MSTRKSGLYNFSSPSVVEIEVPIAGQSITIQYKPEGFIANQVAPICPVTNLATKILFYSKANMFTLQDNDTYIDEQGQMRIFDYEIYSKTVNPRTIGGGEQVDDFIKDISMQPGQIPIQPDIDAAQHAMIRMDLKRELLVSQAIYNNTWADGTTGGTLPSAGTGGWARTDTSNSFITDVIKAEEYILSTTGKKPNVLVMDYATFKSQNFNPVVSDKIKYTQRAVTTAELLADLLQLDEVLVGEAIYTNTPYNKTNTQAFNSKQIWSPCGTNLGNCFLYHRAPPGLRTVAALFQFRIPILGQMTYVRSYRDEPRHKTVYEIMEKIDTTPLATDIGYAWSRTAA